jgi:predicted anti-sigma-YlaC factor YlaD
MLRTGHSAACDRVRAQISLELDSELSQLERAMVAAHVVRCAGCRAFRTGVTAVTRELRAAALEQPPASVLVRRPRRFASVARFQAGVAAAMALTIVGVASQVAAPQRAESHFRSLRVVHFQSQTELNRELAFLGVADSGLSSGSGEATAR